MSAPAIIKVCGITVLEDALAAVEGGATAIGFNFYSRSKRYLAPEAAAAIAAHLPAHVVKVGVFVNEDREAVEEIALRTQLDVAQLHGKETAGQFPGNVRVWKALRVDAAFDVAELERFPGAEAFLLDGPAGSEYGGAGIPFAWGLASGVTKRILIAGGLDATNVRQAIRAARPWGVDACSKIESSPGRKDRAKMMEFLKAATEAEESQ
ncbi:MAG: phosphoribosylanthranilate isomerase [Bryobacterales bacterium]|nr:phosphoribosylanthranilate isomerase [Bryobacterales bacterium]